MLKVPPKHIRDFLASLERTRRRWPGLERVSAPPMTPYGRRSRHRATTWLRRRALVAADSRHPCADCLRELARPVLPAVRATLFHQLHELRPRFNTIVPRRAL